MINEVIDAISIAIDAEFNGEISPAPFEIYTQLVQQGMVKPCFSIVLLNPQIDHFRGNRYLRKHQFCIHYFPSTDDVQTECFGVQERLENCLEYITHHDSQSDVDGGLIRGTEMHGEIVDGVLSFFVNYDFYVYKDKESLPYMETLSSSTQMKG